MRDYVVAVFDSSDKAYQALHALWELGRDAHITVHGAAVIHRDQAGQVRIDSKDVHPALATAIGVGIGVLLGLLATPAAAVLGGATGGLFGFGVDQNRSDLRSQALHETAFVLERGKHAVIADVSEERLSAIDDVVKNLGGSIYRRAVGDLEDDALYSSDYPHHYYLHPYEYEPPKPPAE